MGGRCVRMYRSIGPSQPETQREGERGAALRVRTEDATVEESAVDVAHHGADVARRVLGLLLGCFFGGGGRSGFNWLVWFGWFGLVWGWVTFI